MYLPVSLPACLCSCTALCCAVLCCGAGQEAAKALIQEVVVWPMMNPHIFTVSEAGRQLLLLPTLLVLLPAPGRSQVLAGRCCAL